DQGEASASGSRLALVALLFRSEKVRILIEAGEVEEARGTAGGVAQATAGMPKGPGAEDESSGVEAVRLRRTARGALAGGKLDEARSAVELAMASPVFPAQARTPHLEAAILAGRIYAQSGERRRAMQTLRAAAEEARRTGFVDLELD